MKTHPDQLMIDFDLPATQLLKVSDIARALGITTSKVYAAIDRGELDAIDMSADTADREEWRIHRNAYYAWINNEYPEKLLYIFPKSQWVSVPRVAAFFNISEQWVHNALRDGEFPNAENLGAEGKRKYWRIPIGDLIAFTYRRRAGACC